MFKKILIVLSLAMSVVLSATPAFAQVNTDVTNDILSQTDAAAGPNGAAIGKPVDPRYVVTFIIRIALGLLGTVLFILIIYAGFLWATAGGNEEQVAQAKTTIRNSTIGMVIVLSAYAITIAVTNLATGQTLSSGTQTNAEPLEGAIQNGLFGH